jgi:hypothetical protein
MVLIGMVVVVVVVRVTYCWGPVPHAYNPNYSGGRNQEDCGSKPAQADNSLDPISKIPITKIGLVEWLKVKALSSRLSIAKKKSNNTIVKVTVTLHEIWTTARSKPAPEQNLRVRVLTLCFAKDNT